MTTRLHNPAAFWSTLRGARLLGATIEQSEVDGTNAILAACGDASWGPGFTAYALATALHETAGTMQPIAEYGSNAYFTRMYDIEGARPALARKYGNVTPGDGVRYRGRGYVQLTWRVNYERAERELEHPLVNVPDLAMRPAIAAAIMVKGMAEGWFTGKRLADYIKPGATDFRGARRIINGTDKAALIAGYAETFRRALGDGDWR